jgi:hypothetical protein
VIIVYPTRPKQQASWGNEFTHAVSRYGHPSVSGRAEAGGNGRMQHYRVDRICTARLEAESFVRDLDFDLTTHAAAPTAREFLFHPMQAMTEEDDGSLMRRCCLN